MVNEKDIGMMAEEHTKTKGIRTGGLSYQSAIAPSIILRPIKSHSGPFSMVASRARWCGVIGVYVLVDSAALQYVSLENEGSHPGIDPQRTAILPPLILRSTLAELQSHTVSSSPTSAL